MPWFSGLQWGGEVFPGPHVHRLASVASAGVLQRVWGQRAVQSGVSVAMVWPCQRWVFAQGGSGSCGHPCGSLWIPLKCCVVWCIFIFSSQILWHLFWRCSAWPCASHTFPCQPPQWPVGRRALPCSARAWSTSYNFFIYFNHFDGSAEAVWKVFPSPPSAVDAACHCWGQDQGLGAVHPKTQPAACHRDQLPSCTKLAVSFTHHTSNHFVFPCLKHNKNALTHLPSNCLELNFAIKTNEA